MKGKIAISGIVLFQVIFHYAIAQTNDLKFNLVQGPNGKPLGRVRNMTQDPHGYMWFSAQRGKCIYRYDGNRFTVFRHDDTNPNSLGGTGVNSVYADNTGLIWIGLGDGLDQYNPATGIFKHYRHVPNDPGSLESGGTLNVAPVLKDRQGRLWIGTYNGLDRLDEKTGKFFHYRNEPGNPKSLSCNIVWNIYEDRQGVIWIATGYPWFSKGSKTRTQDPEEGGLNRLESDGTFTRYKHDPTDPHSLINNKVGAMYEDSRGIFWVGTGGDGLHTMDRKTGRFERHLYDPKKADQLSRPPLKPRDGENDKINFIIEDCAGAIWIGTEFSGMNRYDTGTKKITHYEKSNGFPDGRVWNAFTSREGELWITTEDDALYRVNPFYKSIHSIRIDRGATDFAEDKDGYLWVGTDENGLLKYDRNKNLIQQFKHDPSNPFSLFDNDVFSVFHNGGDTIWVGAGPGLRIFNKVTRQFSTFHNGEIIKDSADIGVTHIYQDKKGVMWFSRYGGGLFQYNPKDSSFKHFLPDAEDSTSISSDKIFSFLEDGSGVLWVGGRKLEQVLTALTGKRANSNITQKKLIFSICMRTPAVIYGREQRKAFTSTIERKIGLPAFLIHSQK